MSRTRLAAAVLLAAWLSSVCDDQAEPVLPVLVVEPDSAALAYIGERVVFEAAVTGYEGNAKVRWESADTAVFTVGPAGVVTARGNGRVRLVANLGRMASATAMVRVEQQAAELEAFGTGQRAAAGLPPAEPVGVRVLDAGGTPVSGSVVRFGVVGGGGSVDPAAVASDSAGEAVVVWTLGAEPGRQVLGASGDNGARAELEATAVAPDEAVVGVEVHSGDEQWAVAGEALPEPVAVRVLDGVGRGVPGASARFVAGGGRVEPGEAVSDSAGVARAVWTMSDALGAHGLEASVPAGAGVKMTATVVSAEGACPRTPQVSAELARLAGVGSCADVTEEHLAGIGRMNLSNAGIPRLRGGDFAGLSGLTALWLDHNRLSELPPDVFAGLELQWISVQFNRLSELPPDVFAGMPWLRVLELAGNRLRELPPGVLAGLSSLRTLELRENELSALPSGVFTGLSSLYDLGLVANRLAELPPDVFDGLGRLRLLHLARNELARLPEGVFADLAGLEWISLFGNKLTELPPDLFAGLGRLRAVSLSQNRLATLPGDVFRGTSLEYLWADNNRISELPPDVFAGLSRLEALWLYKNELAELPEGIFAGLASLRWLRLEWNELAGLPEGVFAGLTDLESLRLEWNDLELEELPEGVFAGLSNLERLRLEENDMEGFPRQAFAGVSRLRVLNMSKNKPKGGYNSPVPLAMELRRLDTDSLLAPGPARVAVWMPAGAPATLRVPVSVQLGTGSADTVEVAAGDTLSGELVVRRPSGSTDAVHVTMQLAGELPGGFSKVEVVRGGGLVLFARSYNRSPVVRKAVAEHWLEVDGPEADVELEPYFADPDRDELSYEAEPDDTAVVAARVEDGVLWLEPRAEGLAYVKVSAVDPDSLRAWQRVPVKVRPAPDPDAFRIEVVFGRGFPEPQREEVLKAAERLMEVVTGDLPDVPFSGYLHCSAIQSPGPRLVGTVDDVLVQVYMDYRDRSERPNSVAGAWPCGIREESGLAFYGGTVFNLSWFEKYPEALLWDDVAVHEMVHILGMGIGTPWDSIVAGRGSHFPGPLAVAAFDSAGGEDYEDDKVPLGCQGVHWRGSVVFGEVMAACPGIVGRGKLSAITLQALADMGHVVDVSKADPYTLPELQALARAAAAADTLALPGDTVIDLPVMVVDRTGKVVRVIRK